jgi:hypothetical protein
MRPGLDGCVARHLTLAERGPIAAEDTLALVAR